MSNFWFLKKQKQKTPLVTCYEGNCLDKGDAKILETMYIKQINA